MLVNELAPLLLVATLAINAFAVLFGVLRESLGLLGFLASVASTFLLGWMMAQAAGTSRTMEKSLLASHKPDSATKVSLRRALWPRPYRVPSGVDVSEAVEYMPGQFLDMFQSRTAAVSKAPVLIHVHGGSWSGGNREQQARPLIHAMALRGWLVVAIDYPLVPDATFPDPVVAVHNAVGWIRSHAADLEVDPAQIYLTGGSSGAHLASLAALTDNHSEWSTRRESDPPVAGAVVFYGVFDLLNRHGIRDDWPVVSDGLMKADPEVDPEAFQLASPIDRVNAEAPPFIVVHGLHDSLVPFAESVLFASALQAASESTVELVLLHGASHSFDAVPSLRTQKMVNAVADRLDGLAGRSVVS